MDNSKQETQIVDLLERDGVISTQINTETKQKPYKLRKLSAKDISPMLKIIKKIDLRKLKNVFSELDMTDVSDMIKENQSEETQDVVTENATINKIQEDKSEIFAKIGGALIFEAIPLLLDALDNCINDVNKLLASVANLELEEVEALDLDIYFNLIYDFINKEEFTGFMKVVSKFLNSEK